MSVTVAFPSVNAELAAVATDRWGGQGYDVLIWAEEGFRAPAGAQVLLARNYPGYWSSASFLARYAVAHGADAVVLIGDDMDPDPTRRADVLEREFFVQFANGLGVMQPIGSREPGVDRICGSPWVGAAWVHLAYRGVGPVWPEYGQFFGDQELYEVAKRMGRLWQREDVAQKHHHWITGEVPKRDYQKAASDRWWKHDEDIYRRRKAAGFPCSEFLELV